MKTTPWAELPHWIVLLALFVWTAWCWPAAPDRLPVHWNLAGEPDRYGGRFEALLLVPLIATGLYLFLLLVVPVVARHRLADPDAAGVYRIARLAVTLLVAGVYAVVQLLVFGHPWGRAAMPLIVALLGLFFVTLGIALLRAGPGASAAARGLWPASPAARARTQRLAGTWLLLTGAASILAAAALPRHSVFVLLVGALALGVVTTLHAFLVRRSEGRP